MQQLETVPEIIAHLDEFERDLMRMASKVREYRHVLFAAYSAQGLDSPDDLMLD